LLLIRVSNSDSPGDPLDVVLDTRLFDDLRHRWSSQPEALDAIYRRFFGNTSKLIGTLRDQEIAARRHTLHALKGNAAMLGATRLAALASRLHDDNPDSPAMLAEAIEGLEIELALFRCVIAAHVTLDPAN
jgi:HPt (histidine-containing phosphotransfer) domain-containing protein